MLNPDGRASPIHTALNAVLKWAQKNNVSRVAEVTSLDRIGIPNCYAVRPTAIHPCAVVSSGKGQEILEARAGALFECFERWAAECYPRWYVLDNLKRIRSAFPETSLLIPRGVPEEQQLFWTLGFNPFSGAACIVPLDCAMFPRRWGKQLQIAGYRASTDGIGAGTTPEEAICTAIFELIERDAVSSIDTTTVWRLYEDTLPTEIGVLVQKFRSAGIELSILYCPSSTNIHSFYVLSRDDFVAQSVFFCSGSGCHVNPYLALMRALLEVSQSRVSFISSIRPDVAQRITDFQGVSYGARRRALEHWFSVTSKLHFRELSVCKAKTLPDILLRVRHNLEQSIGLDTLACVILAELDGIYACRVYSPVLNQLN